MRLRETLSLTLTRPNEQRLEVPEAVMRWSRGQGFRVEIRSIERHTRARLQHYEERLVVQSEESLN
ncbi:MAG: hypothetical protein HP490_13175 [Nitrospira sp.]|nr:hypothetical protein [Nitrospira sp.]